MRNGLCIDSTVGRGYSTANGSCLHSVADVPIGTEFKQKIFCARSLSVGKCLPSSGANAQFRLRMTMLKPHPRNRDHGDAYRI